MLSPLFFIRSMFGWLWYFSLVWLLCYLLFRRLNHLSVLITCQLLLNLWPKVGCRMILILFHYLHLAWPVIMPLLIHRIMVMYGIQFYKSITYQNLFISPLQHHHRRKLIVALRSLQLILNLIFQILKIPNYYILYHCQFYLRPIHHNFLWWSPTVKKNRLLWCQVHQHHLMMRSENSLPLSRRKW